MRLIIKHKVEEQLVLPLNYHHVIQAIIYKNLENSYGLNGYMHDEGYVFNKRYYKMFTFSLLKGQYAIKEGKIAFTNTVEFEIRSPENFLIQILARNIQKNGICYGKQYIKNVQVDLRDTTIEEKEIYITMKSPIVVYSTDDTTKRTKYYSPDEVEFAQLIQANFIRKYRACYGVEPESCIEIQSVEIKNKDKYVTKYKDFYITGWKGQYRLAGERKYLDFLYQAGIGAKNSQGFGMFEVITL